MGVVLYTTHCPQCMVLESKLKQSGLEYQTVEDINVMESKGFMSAPVLEVDGNSMNFIEAVKWLKEK